MLVSKKRVNHVKEDITGIVIIQYDLQILDEGYL